jgi:hypothetical protein
MSVYHWAIVIVLAMITAALMAGPNFGKFLVYFTGILVLGLILRQIEKTKKLKDKNDRDDV